MKRAVAAANDALLADEPEDYEPRELSNEDHRASLSGKSKCVEGFYDGVPFSKLVPQLTEENKWRFEKFTKTELKKPANERMRTVRLVKVFDDRRGALVEWMDGRETWEKLQDLMQIQDYVQEVGQTGVDLADGTKFADLRRFIVVNKLPVDLGVLKINLHRGGAAGVDGVKAAIREDGLYLVAGTVFGSAWGHVVVVWKAAATRIMVDGGRKMGLEDAQWMGDIRYIRRVEYQA
ncbi:hypothetical protein ATCC90586_011258 [Pythium insidiosum]|nr:hypothetical protein ATCC90586_011258 [Pythium insidiosum]